MFAEKFENLIIKYPDEAQALQRVSAYFRDMENRKGDLYMKVVLDPSRLFDITKAPDFATLSRLIAVLLSEKVLARELLVESPQGSGIASFSNVSEIPEEMHDPFRDVNFHVSLENIKTIYRPIGS